MPERRGSAASRGYDKDWFRLRARFLRAHPTCVWCGRKAEHVDHIQRIRDRPDLRLDPGNLRALCRSHHNAHSARQGHGTEQRGATADGMPTDPAHPWLRGG